MRHARADYNRIQDPATDNPTLLGKGSAPIGEDEPVFLLRARDLWAPDAVRHWAASVAGDGGHEIAEVAFRWAAEMDRWQNKNGCKMPDMPATSTDEQP